MDIDECSQNATPRQCEPCTLRGALSVSTAATQLEPEHLLIGLLRAQPEAVLRFASRNIGHDYSRRRLVATVTDETRLAETHEVRFSQESVGELERAQIEADDLSDATIRPEHLLLYAARVDLISWSIAPHQHVR